MTEADQTKTIHTFKAPGEGEWRPLETDSDGQSCNKGEVKNNETKLNNALLASLQMQHLVVLAGSGCSLPAGGPSMSDLWNDTIGEQPSDQANDIARTVHYDLNDRNIEEFLSRIEAFLQVSDDSEVASFLNYCKGVILLKCSEFLPSEQLGSHKTFLHRLSRRRVRDQRLKVFTTNYDRCFEEAASEIGGVVLDGFSFAAPRHYDPRFFNYDIIRRPHSGDDSGNFLEGVFLLYKLHGSVNWARSENGTICEKEKPEPQEACLVYPASGKYQQSYTQPYLESMAQYLAAVREPNTCVLVVGFGFNDDHLSEPLLAAARSNPHLRLIIVSPHAEKNTNNGNNYWKQFSALGEQGEDVWFIEADFKAFAEMIPDLKSLTPADTLMKAVQSVTEKQ